MSAVLLIAAYASHIVLTASFPEYKDRYDELLRQQMANFSPEVMSAAYRVAQTVTNNLLVER